MTWLSEAPTGPQLPKALTSIQGLDEITWGGLPRGRSTLVTGGTGTGKTLLGLHFLVAGAREYGEPGVLVRRRNEITNPKRWGIRPLPSGVSSRDVRIPTILFQAWSMTTSFGGCSQDWRICCLA